MKCENCGSNENLFKLTVLSPCKEHTYDVFYCNEHTAEIIRVQPEFVEIIERI